MMLTRTFLMPFCLPIVDHLTVADPLNLEEIEETLVGPLIDGFLQHVRVFSAAGRCVSMYVDDEGLIKKLPINQLATLEYVRNLRIHDPEEAERHRHTVIRGPAVLFDVNLLDDPDEFSEELDK